MDMRQSNQSPQRRATKFIPSPCPQTSFHPPCRGPWLGQVSICGRLEEGRSTALRFSGQNLGEELQAEIQTERAELTTDVVPGTLHIRGNEGGITLHSGTIRDLGENQSRSYRLVLRRPDGAGVTIPFVVAGHNELILDPPVPPQLVRRVVWTNDTPVRFSEINIPAGVIVEIAKTRPEGGRLINGIFQGDQLVGGVLKWESTGRVRISGVIDGHGGNGSEGTGYNGGGTSFLAGEGGQGRRDGGCNGMFLFDVVPEGYVVVGNPDSTCRSSLEAAIGNSARDRTVFSFVQRGGFGGQPGENGNLLEDIGSVLSVIFDFFVTALDAVGCITTGTTCVALVADVANAVDDISDLIEHFEDQSYRGNPGQPGEPAWFSGQLRGHSGGGGGGGGRYNFLVDIDPGGGGGGGGTGGSGISITTAGNVSLGGMLDTHGGNGGDGAEDGDRRNRRRLNQPPDPGRFSGGGGGAGSGGDIVIRSLGRASVPTLLINTNPGLPGLGGALFPADENGGPYFVPHPATRRAEPGHVEIRPAPRPASRELVVTQRLYPVSGSGLGSPATLIVRAEDGTTRRTIVTPGQNTQLTLFDGFNRIYDERDQNGSDLLHRCVLMLPEVTITVVPDDTDGDGFPDAVESAFGSNPGSPSSTPLNTGIGSGSNRGMITARSPNLRVIRPAFGSAQGVESAITVATAPGLRFIRPAFGSEQGVPSGVIMATTPGLRVVRPAIGSDNGVRYGLILSEPPFVRVFRP